MTKISNYLDPKLVTFIGIKNRDETLSAMVDVIHGMKKIQNKEEFLSAIIGRESIVSTGIGMGVAIPHAKLPNFNDFFISIGILNQGVEWDALDGTPVRIVFMIGGPDDKQTEYLQILSRLTLAIKDEERRKKILTLKSPDGIIGLFDEF